MTTSAISEQAWLSYMALGDRNFHQGKLRDAVQAFSKATRLMPGHEAGWVNLGSALFEANRYEDAATAVQRAISINPRLMESHLLLGDVLRMSVNWHEASASYHNAVALQRTPISLNKLACALRVENKLEQAAGLYREAIEMDSSFTLARVNLATLEVELYQNNNAEEKLAKLLSLALPPPERGWGQRVHLALSEHNRLNSAITSLVEHHDPQPLETALRNMPTRICKADKGLLDSIQTYASSARHLSNEQVMIDNELPAEWPLIEAMFMIPLASSVDEYQAIKADMKNKQMPTTELLQLVNTEAAIKAVRSCQLDLLDPVKAELNLRHWHGLACRNEDGLQPGHFKYTHNWIPGNPTQRRVEPALASATFRHFIGEIYSKLAPGYARAAVVYMAIVDLHLFTDGNGRIARYWASRELEWAGLMPCLFHKDQAFKVEMGKSIRAVRSRGGDLSPIITVITKAQFHARKFCADFAKQHQ